MGQKFDSFFYYYMFFVNIIFGVASDFALEWIILVDTFENCFNCYESNNNLISMHYKTKAANACVHFFNISVS